MPYKNKEYGKIRDLNNWHAARMELISKLGGICVNCGTVEELQFDHIDPYSKQIEIRLLIKGRHWDHPEIKKIQLLCKSCHHKKSRQEQSLIANKKHGFSRTAYNRCGPPKCNKCKEWNRKSNGGYRIS